MMIIVLVHRLKKYHLYHMLSILHLAHVRVPRGVQRQKGRRHVWGLAASVHVTCMHSQTHAASNSGAKSSEVTLDQFFTPTCDICGECYDITQNIGVQTYPGFGRDLCCDICFAEIEADM